MERECKQPHVLMFARFFVYTKVMKNDRNSTTIASYLSLNVCCTIHHFQKEDQISTWQRNQVIAAGDGEGQSKTVVKEGNISKFSVFMGSPSPNPRKFSYNMS